MKHNDFSHVIFLENTQTIFNGIERLYDFLPSEGRENAYQDVVDKQWLACYPTDKLGRKTDLRYQNPLYLFFEFLRKDPYWKEPDDIDAICRKSAVQMLALYDAVSRLSKDTSKENIPERFDEFCCRMRDIMDSDMCYLLYSQRDQTELLSNSSYPVYMVSPESDHSAHLEPVSSQLSQSAFDNLRLYIQRARKEDPDVSTNKNMSWQLADTIYIPAMSELYAKGAEPNPQQNLVAIVLDFPQIPVVGSKREWIYIVFQYSKHVPDTEQLLRRVRNLLFIRKKILEHCIEHMYLLLIAQRTCHYIPCLNSSTNAPGANLRIVHLTDLHLRTSNYETAMGFVRHIYSLKKNDMHGNAQPFLKDPDYPEDEQTPLVDLLVITGDVVQASYSAGLLEKNYVLAEKFIRALAAKLWKTKDGFVRSDWQKRIIITPGNHDYASMNELQAESIPGAKRALGIGYPARNEGGPMVKFAYYINFMSQLFRTDINALIQNHLNEVRCYRQLGLTVLSINTVSEAGPLRTNKVLMNPQAGKELIHSTDLKNQFPLLLAHHTPNYYINYLMDRYWTSCGRSFSEQRAWVISFWKCLDDILDLTKITDFVKLNTELEPIRTRLENICSTITSCTSFTLSNPEKYDLLWDIVRTLESLKKPPYLNEQVIALCRSVTADDKMAERDRELLRSYFKELMDAMHYQLVLGGHTHELKLGGKNTSRSTYYPDMEPKDIPFAEGGLFLMSKGTDYTINMGILDFSRGRSLREWDVSAHYHPFLYSSGRFQYMPRTDGEKKWTFYIDPPKK